MAFKKSLKKKLKKHLGGSGKLLKKQTSKDKLKEELTKAAKALPLALPLEEPAQLVALAPEEAVSLKGVVLRVVNDGSWRYGAQGPCLSHDVVSGQVILNGGPGLGSVQVPAQHCIRAENFRKPQGFKPLTALSRATKQEFLSCSDPCLIAEDR